MLNNQISTLKPVIPMSIDEFINNEEERIVEDLVGEPISICQDDIYYEDMDIEDEEKEEIIISHVDAMDSCTKLIRYLEQQQDNNVQEVPQLTTIYKKMYTKRSNSLKQCLNTAFLK